MTVTVDVAAEHIARRIASTIDPVFAMIDGWRDVLERELEGPFAGALTGASEPTAATLDPVVAGEKFPLPAARPVVTEPAKKVPGKKKQDVKANAATGSVSAPLPPPRPKAKPRQRPRA